MIVRRRSLLAAASAATVALLTTAVSGEAAVRGIQFSPSGDQVLVNKDVSSDRWAITLNTDDTTATGNVFRPGGGDPQFISCDPTGENSFACFGADPCSEGGAQRGIQETPNDKRVLVNKDVGIERWAIALNKSDGVVTGNVFRENGGDPAFIVCDPLPAPNSYSCQGADSCVAEPCDDDFTPIGEVTLPANFFQVPEPCGAPFNFIANVTVPDDFFRLTLTDDFVSDIETSTGIDGTLQVGAAPIPAPDAPETVDDVEGDTKVEPGGTSEVDVMLDGGGASALTDGQFSGLSLIVAIANDSCTPGNFIGSFYQISLSQSFGVISLVLSFPPNPSGGNFVLCITTLQGNILGKYFGFEQIAATCGNGRLDSGEVCDPPASQAQCLMGEICGNNCSQCVSSTSCMGRCCPGRDDTCTAANAPCFCDEFCVTAQDCCVDALEQCGFGPSEQAPSISNLTQTLEALNQCELPGGGPGSIFIAQWNYSDPDGNVTPNGSMVDFSFQFSPSGNADTATIPINILSGDGFSGMAELGQCYRFGEDSSVHVSIGIRDDAGNTSNTLGSTIQKPQGAN